MYSINQFRPASKLLVLALLTASLSAPGVAQAQYHYDHYPSFRWGVSGAGGGFAGTVTGLYGGVQVRLGGQITDSFAIYYMGQGLLGSFVPTSSGANFIGMSLNSAIFEGTVGRHFQFGGGPSLDFLFGCSGNPANASCGATPIFFGLDGRMALHFHPLTISFDVHPMFFRPDAMALLLMLGIGVDFE
jgi:hypothetical protein